MSRIVRPLHDQKDLTPGFTGFLQYHLLHLFQRYVPSAMKNWDFLIFPAQFRFRLSFGTSLFAPINLQKILHAHNVISLNNQMHVQVSPLVLNYFSTFLDSKFTRENGSIAMIEDVPFTR